MTRAAARLRAVAHSSPLRHLARAGLLAYALLHILVAALALQLGWGIGATEAANSSGALQTLYETTLGYSLLWVVAVGLLGLAGWQGVEVLRHHRRVPRRFADRAVALLQLIKTVGTALVYAYLGVAAIGIGLGNRGSDDETTLVTGVLGWPGGRLLVGAAAVVVIVIGTYQVYKGLRSTFLDEIDLTTIPERLRGPAHRVSQAGFVGKGLAFLLVGGMLGWAAIAVDAATATGLDGALRLVLMQPFGRWLLTVIALGFAAFAGYLVTRARHPVG